MPYPAANDTDRIAAIEARLATLEIPRKKKRFLWIFADWQEMLKVVALPLTLLYGGLKFYDEVWTRSDRAAEAAAAVGQASLRELQAMNAEIYQMNTMGEGERVEAYFEANRGRVSRLVAEATELWQTQPDYFLANEKQTLANALLNEGRNDVALEIGEELASSAEGTLAQANAALFLGRVTGSEGPAQDLAAMRGHMKRALAYAEGLEAPGRSYSMIQQILISWIFYELYEENCEEAGPIASLLHDFTVPIGEPGATMADRLAAERLQLYAQRCSAE
jgi:hypothetical protein